MTEAPRHHLEDLWTRRAGAGLSTDEERALAAALASDEALRADLLGDERLEGTLGALGRAAHDGDAFTRRFVERLGAEEDGRRFVSAVERRVRAEVLAPRRRRPAWALAALLVPAAAALLLVPRALRERPAPAEPVADESAPRLATTEPARDPVLPGEPAVAPVARVERVVGTAFVVDRARRVAARPGSGIAAGQGLLTVGSDSRAVIAFPDRTWIELGGNAVLHQVDEGRPDLPGAPGKTAFLSRGGLRAQVAPQPRGRPVVFTTPHAEAMVVGTRLALTVSERSTRLDVEAGEVHLAGHAGGERLVRADEYAIAGERDFRWAPRPRGAIVLVVGSVRLGPADERIKRRIEGLGFEVRVQSGGTPDVDELRRAKVVLISSSVHSVDVTTYYRDLPVPIIAWESWLFDDLGMTGPKENGECDAEEGPGEAVIKNPAHPLAAGLPAGAVQLTSGAPPKGPTNPRRKLMMSYGVPGAHAAWVATWPGEPTRAVVFGYERGAPMPGLVAAPARRVGLFLWDDTALVMTEAGWSLLDAAVLWCAEEGEGR